MTTTSMMTMKCMSSSLNDPEVQDRTQRGNRDLDNIKARLLPLEKQLGEESPDAFTEKSSSVGSPRDLDDPHVHFTITGKPFPLTRASYSRKPGVLPGETLSIQYHVAVKVEKR